MPLQQERLGAGGRDDRGIVTSEADGIVRRASCALCVRIDGLLDLAAARLEESGRTLTHAERPRYLLGG